MPKKQESVPSEGYTPEYMPSKETERAIFVAELKSTDSYFSGLEAKVEDAATGGFPTVAAVELLPLIKRARAIIQELVENENIEPEHNLEIKAELNDVSNEIAARSRDWKKQNDERLIGAIFHGDAPTDGTLVIPPDWNVGPKQ